ncbi:MAG: sigma 54-interacting transcriptional regulator [Maricaulaceae bacterium]
MAARPPQLIGESPAFHRLMDQISDLASLERPITLTGERGTGKGLLAARLHFLSPRWEQGFFAIDSSTLYKEIQTSHLFGDDETDGKILEANNGTLMIDHIDHLSLSVQKRLLHLLESGQVLPSGGGEPIEANIRIIAATRNNLAELMRHDLFDPDLLDRLAFAHIHIPPLRERREDLLPLVQYFGRHMASELGAGSFPGFTPEALLEMESKTWSGNIGELKTAVERSVAESFLADETLSQPIQTVLYNPLLEPSAAALPFEIPSSLRGATIAVTPPLTTSGNALVVSDRHTPATPKKLDTPVSTTSAFHDRVMAFERALIDEAMRIGDGHQGRAAAHLDMSYHAFRGLLRKHGLKK